MKMLKAATIIAALSAVPALADPADDVRATLARADSAHREALALEHGWAVTAPLMDEARAALEAGDVAGAQAIADRALLTAEKSLEQAHSERDSWTDRVVQR